MEKKPLIYEDKEKMQKIQVWGKVARGDRGERETGNICVVLVYQCVP